MDENNNQNDFSNNNTNDNLTFSTIYIVYVKLC